MAIVAGELKWYRSATVSDASTNGGRMSANLITSGASSNVFPVAEDDERLAGSTKYRKIFGKVANDADSPGLSYQTFVEKFTPGDDRITIFPGTQTDTQATITGSERQYGCGQLNANRTAGQTQLAVLCETGATGILQDNDVIRISDKASIAGAGNTEFVTITNIDSTVGDVVTVTFTPALANNFLAADTRVASVYAYGDVEPTVDNLVVSSAGSGDFNIANLLGDSIGGVDDTFTCTFTSATAFDIVGSSSGAVGSGSVGAGASPNNASFSKPYFVMQAAGFTGTWAAADTIVFQTHPAAVPMWAKRVIPAASAPAVGNAAKIVQRVQTA